MALSSASRRFSARRGALKGRFRQTVLLLLYLFRFFFVVRGTVIQVKEFAQSICPPTHFYYSLLNPKEKKKKTKKRKRKKKIHDAARRHRLTTVASIVVMWDDRLHPPRRRGGGGEHRRPNARAAGPTTTTTTTTTTTVFGAATQKSRLPPRERGGPSPSPSLLFRSKTSLSGRCAKTKRRVEGTRDARADIDEHRDERDENDDELDEIARGAVSAWTRAIDDRSAPSAQKKRPPTPFGQTTTLSSSSFGTGPPPQPSSRKRELTKTTTEQHAKNGRQTAPPIAPKIKLREPPVLA